MTFSVTRAIRTLLLALVVMPSFSAQSQSVAWLNMVGGLQGEVWEDVTVDHEGNVFAAGKFSGTLPIGDSTFTFRGFSDIVVAKYDSSGNFLWARHEGGPGEDVGVELDVDAAGNVYVGGRFSDTALFDGVPYGAEGLLDIFVIKYTTDGDFVWLNTLGGNKDDRCRGLVTDDAGFTYITGRYRVLTLFDTIFLPAVATDDVYLAKLDTTGDVMWAQTIGGTKLDFGEAITIDLHGNLILTGSFFQNMTIGDSTLLALGDEETFVAKWDNDGNLLWANSYPGAERDYGEDIATDEFGNIFVSGAFSDEVIMGRDTLHSYGMLDFFHAKLDPDGNTLWATSGGSPTGNDVIWGSDYDGKGNTIVTGWFRGNLNLPPAIVDGTNTWNIFAAKFDASGELTWVNKLGSYDSEDIGRGVSCDPLGNPVVVGAWQDTSFYDGTEYIPASVGPPDMFMAKLNSGLDDCAISHVFIGDPTDCSTTTGFYTVDLEIYHYYAPDSGKLEINSKLVDIMPSPQFVTLDSLVPNSEMTDIALQFTANPECFKVVPDAFVAPAPCGICSIDTIYVDSVRTCKPVTNRYSARVTIEHSFPPDTGNLIVNGQVFAIQSSPQTVTLDALYSNGLPLTVTAYFSEEPACTYTALDLFTAPDTCAACEINAVVVNSVGDCDPLTNTYQAEVGVNILAWPSSGGLEVNGQVYEITGIPMFVTLSDLPSDGLPVDVTARFEEDTNCLYTQFAAFTAPTTCDTCAITAVNVTNLGACDQPTQQYDIDLEILYGSAPGIGDLSVNGMIFPVTGSPQIVTLTGLTADGNSVDLEVIFTGDSSCSFTDTAMWTAPAPCLGCLVNGITVDSVINNCIPTAPTYDLQVSLDYVFAPATGSLDINGQSFPITSSPQTEILTGLAPTGALTPITAYFTAYPSCTLTDPNAYTSPEACDTCAVPVNLTATLDSLMPHSVLVEWDDVSDAIAYRVRGRRATTIPTSEANTFTNGKVVHYLNLNTTYAWTVQSYCPYDTSDFAEESHFTTFGARISGSAGELSMQMDLYPNPAVDFARLLFSAEEEGQVELRLTGLDGKVYASATERVIKGQNLLDMNLGMLPAGIFMVEAIQDDRRGALRLVISQ